MKTSALVKSTFVYSLGNILNKVIGFILLPLYTSYLTTEDYGILDVFLVGGTILFTVLGFRISSATMRWCAEEKHKKNKGKIIFTSFVFLLLVALAINLLFQPISPYLSQLFFSSATYTTMFQVALIWVGFEIMIDLPLQLMRLEERATLFITVSFVRLLTVLGLNIYFIVYAGKGVEGILLSQMIGAMVAYTLAFPFLFRLFNLQLFFGEFRAMIIFCFPIAISSLSALILNYADRFVFTYYGMLDDLGTYSLGYRIASLVQVVIITSFQLSFTPLAYKQFEQDNFKTFYAKTATHFFIVLGFAACGLSLIGADLLRPFILSDSFLPALTIVPVLAFFFILKGLEYIFTLTLHLSRQTQYILVLVLIALAVNIPLNFIFIPQFGLLGAALTSVVAAGFGLFFAHKYGQQSLRIPYHYNALWKLSFLFVTGVALGFYLQETSLAIRLTVGGLWMISFPWFVFRWKIMDKVQMLELQQNIIEKVKEKFGG